MKNKKTGKLERRATLLPISPEPAWQYREIRRLEDLIERINRANLSHTFVGFRIDRETGKKRVFPLNPCVRRVFTNEIYRGGRLYSFGDLSVQQVTKADRKSVKIDGKPATYLDLSASHTRMRYNILGIDPDPKADIYRPEAVLPRFYASNPSELERAVARDFVKTATNTCYNTVSRVAADKSVLNTYMSHEHPDFMRRLFQAENCLLSAREVVTRILAAHPELAAAGYFFNPGLADLLTWVESMVMLKMLAAFASAGRPAMGFHGGVLCKASDRGFPVRTMTATYRTYLGYDPVIKREF